MKQVESILYVDDDLDDQSIFIEALQEVHPSFKCQVASNGIEALELLQTIAKPLCIYLDINMPMMDGIETLKRLKADAELSHIPVFMLSTSRSASHEIEARRLGATDYLTKPNAYCEYVRIISTCFTAHVKV
jgi:CheY-like chemotaxis protein